MAAQESKRRSERVKAGMARAKAEGKTVSGRKAGAADPKPRALSSARSSRIFASICQCRSCFVVPAVKPWIIELFPGAGHHHGRVKNTTPLWVPLLVAGIAVLGTLSGAIAGAVITQRQANRREDKTWARERERERESRAREDEARTFEHRREAYADFYEAVKAMARMAYAHGSGEGENPRLARLAGDDPPLPGGDPPLPGGNPPLPGDWYSEAFGKLSRLSLYADRRVAAAASTAYTAAWDWGMNSKMGELDETASEGAFSDELEEFNKGWGEYQDAELKLLVVIREALSIPEGDLTLPPPRPAGAPDGFAPETWP